MLGERNPGATPFAWSHAQLIRLAWSVETRTPVELPGVVAARYTSAAG
jgi:glucoamylase